MPCPSNCLPDNDSEQREPRPNCQHCPHKRFLVEGSECCGKDIESETNSADIPYTPTLWDVAAAEINYFRENRLGVTPACAQTIKDLMEAFERAGLNQILPIVAHIGECSELMVLFESVDGWSFGIYVDAEGMGFLEIRKAGEEDNGSSKPHFFFAEAVVSEFRIWLEGLTNFLKNQTPFNM